MRKTLILFLLFAAVFTLNAQYDFDSQGIIFTNGNKVNIGSSAFNSYIGKMHVNGTISVPQSGAYLSLRTDGLPHNVLSIDSNNDFVFNSSSLTTFGNRPSKVVIVMGDNKGFELRDAANVKQLVLDESTGNMGLGTSNTSNHKLAVKGDIGSEEVQVKQNIADYVFKTDYNLMSISDLEQFISQNGHLPNVQSEKDVEENNGYIRLGSLAVSVLEKVEELTLHLIDLNKRIVELEKENKILKASSNRN